jgi:Mg2+ and Co2+ transporter CorA
MNVPVPFQHTALAFAAILGVLIATVAVLLGIFKWLRWV